MIKILKASAGSGKTYNLAREYIRLLLTKKDRQAYRHILAVKASNEHLSGFLRLSTYARIVNIIVIRRASATKYHRSLRHVQLDVALEIKRVARIDHPALQRHASAT